MIMFIDVHSQIIKVMIQPIICSSFRGASVSEERIGSIDLQVDSQEMIAEL